MATKTKIKRVEPKLAPLQIGDDTYVVRTNLSMRMVSDLNSGEIDRLIVALRQIVVEHPWTDDDGQPLDPADWSPDMAAAVIEAYGGLLKALPPD